MSRIEDGLPYPLGAIWTGTGVNFALFSAHASAVEICLFDRSGRRELERINLPLKTDQVWHGHVRGLLPGQLYGYRVHGPYDPKAGHRFNPHKLLIDPYARQLHGRIRWHDALFGYRTGAHRGDLTPDRRDSAPLMPKCVVEDGTGDGLPTSRPNRTWAETLIYEAHIKGLTQRHPGIPPVLRGTYGALAHPAIIEHLLKLGITAIELLPIHAFVDDRFLVEKGLRNYWGYSTLAYFAPEPRYYGDGGVPGLKQAVRALHEAGIEVILDVVYNHTAEGNHLGPTLSFRGIDNLSYYKLSPETPRFYWDSTGTGNTLNVSHPRVLQMVLDSLRHWIETYDIDGFRFDLASTVARDPSAFSEQSAFLRATQQDPLISRVKLIAEPWDVGDGGYRVGGFPPGWSEWNDQYRDTVRAFWRGDPGKLPELARVMTACQEIFEWRGRHPWASVNFVTTHDGFTLRDLVSYNDRHNDANGEENRDGHGNNLSWNCGIEGETQDDGVLALRARQVRNLIATLLLSHGVPMILMGDERARSQGGNNNAYAQDSELSWIDWEGSADPSLQAFVETVSGLRRRMTAFRRRHYLTGRIIAENGLKDVYWLAPEGREMSSADWHMAERRTLGIQFGNEPGYGPRLLLILNADPSPLSFSLPEPLRAASWIKILDTAPEWPSDPLPPTAQGGSITCEGRTLLLFEECRDGP